MDHPGFRFVTRDKPKKVCVVDRLGFSFLIKTFALLLVTSSKFHRRFELLDCTVASFFQVNSKSISCKVGGGWGLPYSSLQLLHIPVTAFLQADLFLKLAGKRNVVPRSTMNINGGTEN